MGFHGIVQNQWTVSKDGNLEQKLRDADNVETASKYNKKVPR